MLNQNKNELSIPKIPIDLVSQRQFLIKHTIKSLRQDMRLLIEFAIGSRTLHGIRHKRTALDDQRLLWCLTQLRKRVEDLQKQLKKHKAHYEQSIV
jgi:hypothetical protein